MERENKNQREVDKDGVKETGQRKGLTAVRAPSFPLCTHFFVLLCTLNWFLSQELLPPLGTWGHSAVDKQECLFQGESIQARNV